MDPFNEGPTDLEKKMETDLAMQLQAMSTNNTWVPLETLIPKMNAKFKKYNASLPLPKDD